MKDPIELVRQNIRALAPYSTARDEYTGPRLDAYLDANENPYDNGYNRYPDPYQRQLKERISQIKDVAVPNIFIGNGSDEAIDLVYRVFCDPRIDNSVSIAPTYGMYKVAAATNDVEFREVQLLDDYSLDIEGLLAAVDSNTKLMFLCSPNNPTGNAFPAADIEKLLRSFDGMVVLDEAYADFCEDGGWLSRLAEFPNLIIFQTLSKAWGMAGLRLGLAFAREDIIALFTRVKYPYNINGPTQQIVLEQLNKDVRPQVAEIKTQRDAVVKKLQENPLVRGIFPSDANFVLIKVDDPKRVYDELIGGGVIVRNRSQIKGCEGTLRITIGTPEENNTMLGILDSLAKKR